MLVKTTEFIRATVREETVFYVPPGKRNDAPQIFDIGETISEADMQEWLKENALEVSATSEVYDLGETKSVGNYFYT